MTIDQQNVGTFSDATIFFNNNLYITLTYSINQFLLLNAFSFFFLRHFYLSSRFLSLFSSMLALLPINYENLFRFIWNKPRGNVNSFHIDCGTHYSLSIFTRSSKFLFWLLSLLSSSHFFSEYLVVSCVFSDVVNNTGYG